MTKQYLNDLVYQVTGAAIEVHKHLGPGLLENVYEKCLLRELTLQNINYRNQICVPVNYKGLPVDCDLRLDALIEDVLCVELKAQVSILPIHHATLLSYMHMLAKPKGLLINFHCTNIARDGQKTFVNQLYSSLPEK